MIVCSFGIQFSELSGQTGSGDSTKVSLTEEGSPTDESSSHLPTDRDVANPTDLKQAKPVDMSEQYPTHAKSPTSDSSDPKIANPVSPKSVPVSNEEFFNREGQRNEAQEASLPEEIEKLLSQLSSADSVATR